MPDAYLITFELLLYALLFACMHHAANKGLHVLWRLIAGVLFGVLLEWATIQQLHAYEYGRFLIIFDDVPLAIGVGWGIIIYSAQLVSDATSLPIWVRPILDGLLALNIDLAMDAIAIRLGMWHWGIDINAQYFGVPYANFWAWFWVVFSFSLGVRLLSYRGDWIGRWLAPINGIVVGVVVGLSTNFLITAVIPNTLYISAIVSVIGTAFVFILLLRPSIERTMMPHVAVWVPLGFHLYFLVAGSVSRIFMHKPVLLAVSILMLVIALYIHRPVLQALLPTRDRTEQTPA